MEQVPVAPFLSSWLPVFDFLSLGISLFWITPIDGFRQYLSFVFLVCFAEYNIFKVHPNCSMCQNFLIMDEYYSVVCLHHCAIYWFLCGWTLDLLWSFGYCEWCSNEHWYNNIYLSPFFPFFFLGIYPEVELLGPVIILCLTLWRPANLFSPVAAPFHIPTSTVWVLW